MPQPSFEWLSVLNSILLLGIIFGGFIKYRAWAISEEKRKRELAKLQEDLILSVCERFTNTREYKKTRDERMEEIAQRTIDEAFRTRASSFVEAGVYASESRALRRELDALMKAINENTRSIAELTGALSQMVWPSVRKVTNHGE